MATNREKYYSTNRQLAEELVGNRDDQYCSHCPIAGERCKKLHNEKGIKITTEDCIKEIEQWLTQEAEERTCRSCKFHKKVKPCISAIDKKCVNPKSKDYGAYTMDDCSCDVWEAKEDNKEKSKEVNFIKNEENEKLKWEKIKSLSDKIDTMQNRLDKLEEYVNTQKDFEKHNVESGVFKNIFSRLDKLEKCNRIAEVKEQIGESLKEKTKDIFNNKDMRPMTQEDAEELVDKIGCCAEEVRQMNKTADQMFEGLGYEQASEEIVEYRKVDFARKGRINENEKTIIIYINSDYSYEKLSFEKGRELDMMPEKITETEDKAIHKKIEELKNGN